MASLSQRDVLISSILPSTGGQSSEQKNFSSRQRVRALWGRPLCVITITKKKKQKVKETFPTWSQNWLFPATLLFNPCQQSLWATATPCCPSALSYWTSSVPQIGNCLPTLGPLHMLFLLSSAPFPLPFEQKVLLKCYLLHEVPPSLQHFLQIQSLKFHGFLFLRL